jgi:hypothetical protein
MLDFKKIVERMNKEKKKCIVLDINIKNITRWPKQQSQRDHNSIMGSE